MTTTVTALVSTLVLSVLAFDPRDTAYWRRWLGRNGYLARRALLSLVPLTLAVVLSLCAPASKSLGERFLEGVWIGVTVAAVLKADPGHNSLQKLRKNPDPAQWSSLLTLIHHLACRRFDAAAERGITAHLARQKVSGPGHPKQLIDTAEEFVVILDQEKNSAPARSRAAAQERLDAMCTRIDVLRDPMATGSQRQRAAFALSESLAEEMTKRRWSRPPVHQ